MQHGPAIQIDEAERNEEPTPAESAIQVDMAESNTGSLRAGSAASIATATANGDPDREPRGDTAEETQVDLYPGPDEQKKQPFLVEFGPEDAMNPKVRVPWL